MLSVRTHIPRKYLLGLKEYENIKTKSTLILYHLSYSSHQHNYIWPSPHIAEQHRQGGASIPWIGINTGKGIGLPMEIMNSLLILLQVSLFSLSSLPLAFPVGFVALNRLSCSTDFPALTSNQNKLSSKSLAFF